MRLPFLIGKPLFRSIYPHFRRMQGSPVAPFCRRVTKVDPDAAFAFNRLYNQCLLRGPHRLITYDLPYPKIEFLNFLCDWRGIVAHGSPIPALKILKPIRNSKDISDFGNLKQVFVSPDAIWALWFAILDKKLVRRTRNGCVGIGNDENKEKYYHFELEQTLSGKFPFTPGTIYLARAADFPARHQIPILSFFGAEFEEWGSMNPCTPLAKIAVEPEDFPYMDQVQYCLV